MTMQIGKPVNAPVVSFTNNDQFILTEEEQQMIIDKFPDKLRPFLSKCNNPLDETQILVHLFKDNNVRIILRQEENLIGQLEYCAYFHTADIAETVKYNKTDTTQWAARWKVQYMPYENLVRQFDGPNFVEINKRKTDKNANYINEQDLKKVLLKINTKEASTFQEWILKQSTIMKFLLNEIVKIKHQQELEQKTLELDKCKKELESTKTSEKELMELSLNAVKLFPQPAREAGTIYIATSPDYQKKYTYKIGLTTVNAKSRESSMQTSNPDINIVGRFAQ